MGFGLKNLVLVFLLLVVSSIAFGAEYNVSIFDINKDVFPGEIGEFEIRIDNLGSSSEIFTIYIQSSRPGWFTQKDYNLAVAGRSFATTSLFVTPGRDAVDGNQGFFVYVYPGSESADFKRIEAFVVVLRNETLILDRVITDKPTYTENDAIKVVARVKSVVRRNIDGYSVLFESGGESKTVRLPLIRGGEIYDAETEFSVSQRDVGENGVLATLVDSSGNEVEELSTFFVVPAVEKISVEDGETDVLLWKEFMISIVNNGNIPKAEFFVTRDVSSFLSLITTSSDNLHSKKGVSGGQQYTWKIDELSPGEEVVINYRHNYFVLYLIVLGFLLVGYLAFREYHSLRLVKKAYRKGNIHTVHIYLVNNSSRRINKVRVVDYLPNTCNVSDKFEFNTPVIRKGQEKFKLTWELGSIESKDERVVTYKFAPKIKVEEGVILGSAHAVFIQDNKSFEIKSNVVKASF